MKVLKIIWITWLILLAGCGQQQNGTDRAPVETESELQADQTERLHEGESVYQSRENDYPEDVAQWIERLKRLDQFPLWHSKVSGDSLYIYISWGEKRTGGYQVRIAEKNIGEHEIEITADFQSPAPDAMVTQALTYPYTVAVLEKSDKPVQIHKTGEDAPGYLQTIKGIETLPEIVAGSERIILFEPNPGSRVKPGFEVRGLATVFEGTVNYRLLGPDGETIKEGYTTTVDGLNWAYFSFVPEPGSISEAGNLDTVILQLFSIDAKDGEEKSRFDIPLHLNRGD